MKDLVYELLQICARNRDGSFATQANRRTMLKMMGEQLYGAGYKDLHAHDLKGRHVNKLLALWASQQLSHATIRNRLSALRWLAEKLGRRGILPLTNAPYQFTPRQCVARISKAKELPDDQLVRIADRYIRMSLELQKMFGLRRAESMLIRPWQADEGDQLHLQGSWCKGGRERLIPVITAEQREVLDRAKALVKRKQASLIPAHLSYKQQIAKYEYWCKQVGLSKMHGLRHAFFQRRYEALTGFPCPVLGGPHAADLSPEQRYADEEARAIIAEEMGHCRIQICANYLGR